MDFESQQRQRLWLIPLAFLATIILGVISILSCIHVERDRDSRGCIAPREEWPEKLADFFQIADQRRIPIHNLKAFHGLHDDFFWKCDATPELLRLMIDQWKLTKVTGHHVMFPIVFNSMPKEIQPVLQTNVLDYYVSAEYLPGGEWKGHLYCVIYDKTEKYIIVRYYYNF
jgi:hypothetical protein